MKIATLALALLLASPTFAQHASPYSGQETRNIKALDEKDVAGLLTGSGMGFAKTAELNSYPGPRHVLDAAGELKLSADQKTAIQQIFDRMEAGAKALGRHVVAGEAALDALFAKRQIDAERLGALTGEIGVLQGRLRAVHLQAHLETTTLLTPQQVAAYDALRSYSAEKARSGPPAHGGQHGKH